MPFGPIPALPALHSTHRALDGCEVKPRGHWRQASGVSLVPRYQSGRHGAQPSPANPGSQEVHLAEPSTAPYPMPQGVHFVVRFFSAEAVPSAQFLHVNWPVMFWYMPGMLREHRRNVHQYVEKRGGSQGGREGGVRLNKRKSTHTRNSSTHHGKQNCCPASSWYQPCGHEVHPTSSAIAALALPKRPCGHGTGV